jgi:hypothetical protein
MVRDWDYGHLHSIYCVCCHIILIFAIAVSELQALDQGQLGLIRNTQVKQGSYDSSHQTSTPRCESFLKVLNELVKPGP